MLHTIAVAEVALPRDSDARWRGATFGKCLSPVALGRAWLQPSPIRPRRDSTNGSRQRCAVVIWIVASVINALIKSITLSWQAE
jgi:hypothetical protein